MWPLHRGQVVRQHGEALRALGRGRRGAAAAPGAMPVARAPRREIWPGARSRARPAARSRSAPAGARGGDADRGVRVDQLAGRRAAPRPSSPRSRPRRRARHRTARARARAHRRVTRRRSCVAKLRPSARARAAPSPAAQIEQQALEIAGDLDVHARADGRHDRARADRRRSRRSAPGCRCGWWRRSAGRSAGPCRARRSRHRRRRNCRSARRTRPGATGAPSASAARHVVDRLGHDPAPS